MALGVKGVLFEDLYEYSIQQDETLILCSKTTAYQFRKDGSLILSLGTSGDGPGEFLKMYGAYSTKDYIIIQDSRQNAISFFDHKGRFVKRISPKVKRLYFFKDFSLRADLKAIMKNEPPLNVFRFNDNLEIENLGESFHFVRPEMERFEFNFSDFTICEANGLLYVMDELVPEVSVYNKKFKRVQKFNISLPYFIPLTKAWEQTLTRKQGLRYIKKHAFIHQIGSLHDGLAVSYSAPNNKDPDDKRYYISIVDFKGEIKSKQPFLVNEMFLGTLNNEMIILSMDEDLQYYLNFFRYAP